MPTRRLATPAVLRALDEAVGRAQAPRDHAQTAALVAAVGAAKGAIDTPCERRHRPADAETIAATLERLATQLRAAHGPTGGALT